MLSAHGAVRVGEILACDGLWAFSTVLREIALEATRRPQKLSRTKLVWIWNVRIDAVPQAFEGRRSVHNVVNLILR